MGRLLAFRWPMLLVGVMAVSGGCAARSLTANGAFSYACAAGGECGVYLTILNPSREPDTLVAVRSDVAARAELHRLTTDEQGELTMEQVERIQVPATDKVDLKPGSLHIMLLELKKELKAGDTFALTLVYENSGENVVDVLVTPEN